MNILKSNKFRQAFKVALAGIMSCHLYSNAIAGETLIIDGSTGVKPLVESLVKEYQKENAQSSIEVGAGLNPSARIEALIRGEINIAMASHGIDTQQITELGLQVHRIAKMAVVIGVNTSVNLRSVNHEALCDIYSGKITNWKSLTGKDANIKAFIRPFNEVDSEVILEHIPCFSGIIISDGVVVKAKSGEMARALSKISGSIGMTTMVRVAKSDGMIRPLSLNGIAPNSNNLLSKAYPLTRDSFLITQLHPDESVMALLSFIQSERGKSIIVQNNAIPAK